MRNDSAKRIAISGMLAAVAMVIMSLGGLIPVATYVCPVLCMVVSCIVLRICGKRYAWTWYGAVCLLSLLIGPDKEAAAVYVALGYYPMIKSVFDRFRFSFLCKSLYFNAAVFLLYGMLIYIFGLDQLYTEFSTAGMAGLCTLLLLGNVTFFLLDRVLQKFLTKR